MIIVLNGPTCTGKSKTAIELASLLNGEIINGDAFQIYKEMNIGVAKPSLEDFKNVTHHLYSIIDVDQPFSIFDYQKIIRNKIEEVISRGKTPIIVGGSGLYIRSALYDYKLEEKSDNEPLNTYDNLSNEELFEKLKEIDPSEALKLHPNNRKRVLRAIQIFESQGKNKTELLNEQEHKLIYDAHFFVRDLDREVLYERINKRVDLMFKQGLLEEAKCLFDKYGTSLQSMQAIGYKELVDVIYGNKEIEIAKEEIKKNTRNYAKRQLTFIRHQFPVQYYKTTEDILGFLK